MYCFRFHYAHRALTLLFVGLSFVAVISCGGCALPAQQSLPQRYVSQFERDVEGEVSRGLLAAQKGRYVDAEFAFRRALLAVPQNERLQLNLATALGRQQLFQDAEQIYRDVLRSNPNSIVAKAGLARLYVDQAKYVQAERLYLEILRDTDIPEELDRYADVRVAAYRSLAALSFRQGFEEEATCHSAFAVGERPGNVAERVRHSKLLLSRGLLVQLDEYLREVDPQATPDPLLHQVVLLRYEQNRLEDARLLCETLVSKPQVDVSVEADCLWILAFVKNFTIANIESERLDEELRIRGFELGAREFDQSENTLFAPLRLTDQIMKTQEAVLLESSGGVMPEEGEEGILTVDQLTLFAYPATATEGEQPSEDG